MKPLTRLCWHEQIACKRQSRWFDMAVHSCRSSLQTLSATGGLVVVVVLLWPLGCWRGLETLFIAPERESRGLSSAQSCNAPAEW